MNTRVKAAVVVAVIIAVVGPAWAQKNFNSAKSNTSTTIGKSGAKAKYSYSFNWKVDSSKKVLSKAEIEILLERVFDEIRADVLR